MAIKVEESFEVEAPVDQVWAYFADPPRVVPCIVGAELSQIIDEQTYEGRVALKVGPVNTEFTGIVVIDKMDAEVWSAELRARGNQQGKAGRADAHLRFALKPITETCTEVHAAAEITITGQLAKLGSGMIQLVTRQLFREFAKCIREEILAADTTTLD